MRPVLFQLDLPLLGQVSFPSYLTLVMVGFLVAVIGARTAAGRAGLDGERIVDVAIFCLVLGLVGARLLAVLTDGKLMDFVHLCTDPARVDADDARVVFCASDRQCGFDYLCDPAAREAVVAGKRRTMCHPPRDCLAALKFWQGGLTLYGGLLLALPGALLYCRRKRLDFLRVADLLAPWVLVGQAIGRIGCLLEGCCYGAATSGPLGVKLPGHAGPTHPTQIYEALADLALAALVARVGSGRRGARLGWMLIGYAVVRALLELLRADPRGSLGPLSTSQIIAAPAVAVGAWLVVRSRRGGERAGESLP